jgi:hypothetical protein
MTDQDKQHWQAIIKTCRAKHNNPGLGVSKQNVLSTQANRRAILMADRELDLYRDYFKAIYHLIKQPDPQVLSKIKQELQDLTTELEHY